MDEKVEVTEAKLLDLARWIILQRLNTSDIYMAMAIDIAKLVAKKNHDYGDAWQRYGIFTPLIRLNDKLLRVKTLAGGEKALVSGEAIRETMVDIVAYGLLCILRIDWEAKQSNSTPFQPGLFTAEDILQQVFLDKPKNDNSEQG